MRRTPTKTVLAGAALALLAAALLLDGSPVSGQAPPKDQKAVDELIKALQAADPDVRRQAVEALAQLGQDKVRPIPNSVGKPVLTLEPMLAQAAQDNPDIRVAEAKLREADAELNRTRLLVAQKVVKLYQDVTACRDRTASQAGRAAVSAKNRGSVRGGKR
jgi:HEAT repeat protein